MDRRPRVRPRREARQGGGAPVGARQGPVRVRAGEARRCGHVGAEEAHPVDTGRQRSRAAGRRRLAAGPGRRVRRGAGLG